MKPRPGSSPLIRNSKEWPRLTGSSSRMRSPAAMRSCSRTRSTPATSSVTGCSTWSRVLTSRNEMVPSRSEEHTSELQSRFDLVCRLLLEKKKTKEKETQEVLTNVKELQIAP